MSALGTDDTLVCVRQGMLKIKHRRDVPLDRVLAALETPGECLKTSRKSDTRKVDAWVVKESLMQGGVGILKHTMQRARYRQGWVASRFLERHGVPVPRPLAFVEWGWGGVITGNAFISSFLEGYRNVEQYAREELLDADAAACARFLAGLADTVNGLTATGAYHSDLSGKNIFTKDGAHFCFIDLDGVVLGETYSDTLRMKNHVQLYDSFCDWWGPELLDPFIMRMVLTNGEIPGTDPAIRSSLGQSRNLDAWLVRVHEGQQQRRATHVKKNAR